MKAARSSIKTFRALTLLGVLVGAVACGSSEVGEECDDVGSADECEDGAICTTDRGGTVCRRICDTNDQCPADHECNGVSGTNVKSCQPKV
jgi:hypothetical protein